MTPGSGQKSSSFPARSPNERWTLARIFPVRSISSVYVGSGSILSKKVFLAGEKNFSAPLVHPARADVRDHVESQEGDHRASYASDRGLQKRRQRKTDFREIWGAA